MAIISLFWIALYPLLAQAFLPVNLPQLGSSRQPVNQPATWRFFLSNSETTAATNNDNDPLEGLDDKRRQNLFQALLRDLQIEGVPLLECDVSQAHTLQAALWTTMAELSEQDDGMRVCLVMGDMAVDSLKTFVNDFSDLKTQDRLMEYLPELQRFNISVVGKGVGPAIIIQTANKTSSGNTPGLSQESGYDENAMKSFVEGLEANDNIQHAQIGYRFCGFSEACHVLSAFWNCICELLSVSEDQLSSTVLSTPAIQHTRFAAVTELLSRSLCLFRGDDLFQLLPCLEEADNLSEDDLMLSNYQRGSPFSAVVIKRISK